jgi:peptide/nickel transport system substrate-binding protein
VKRRAHALALATLLSGCAAPPSSTASDVLSVSVEQQSAWVRNFNPLLVEGARWPTRSGIFEPMLIWNAVTSAWVPWLATDHAWSSDLRRLHFTIRDGVQWSDGHPFTAADVVFTFELLHKQRALDAYGVWNFLASVRAPDAHTVEMDFSRPYVPGLADVAMQPIVPQHLWDKIADPLTYANPNPVGTGPFTEVRVFRNQVYELGRNPHYWQAGKPAVAALRMVAYPSNDQANLALVEGEVDWAGNFVPAIDRTFVSRDRALNGYWFPSFGSMVFLYPNTQRPPFDDLRVRRALSLALDRQRVVDVAQYGYAKPTDGTGLSDAYATWRDPTLSKDGWVRHDLAAAEKLLDEAGLRRGSDGVRRMPDGKPLSFELEVVSGWSDWVRAGQVLARELGRAGITVHLRTYEFSTWFSRLQTGAFELSIGWSLDAPTPYQLYRGLLSHQTLKPIGEAATGNYHRFADPQADELLTELERTGDPARQHALMSQLEARFVATAPAIPLFPNPLWGAFSRRRFDGFPDAAGPYAKLSPHSDPERLLVLTSLVPRRR